MTEQIKPWGDFIIESRKVITESEQYAKDEAMKAVDLHFKSLYGKLEKSEADAFKSFLSKMKKL